MGLGGVPLLRRDRHDSLEPLVDIPTAVGYSLHGSDLHKVILAEVWLLSCLDVQG